MLFVFSRLINIRGFISPVRCEPQFLTNPDVILSVLISWKDNTFQINIIILSNFFCGQKIGLKRFLEESHWKPIIVFWKGKPKFPSSSKVSAINGFNHSVSDAAGSRLDLQVRDAKRFLKRERLELKRLKRLKLHGTLDFGVEAFRDAPMKFYRFDARLISLLADVGIDLELSQYAVEARDDV